MSPIPCCKPIVAEQFKTRLCLNFIASGACVYDSKCMFAHGECELRTRDMNVQDHLVTEDAILTFRALHRAHSVNLPHSDLFRTTLCDKFGADGCCPYESRCMFAHGDHELRTKQANFDEGLTTPEAVHHFQQQAYSALRESVRRKRRNEKKRINAKARKAAHRETLSSHESKEDETSFEASLEGIATEQHAHDTWVAPILPTNIVDHDDARCCPTPRSGKSSLKGSTPTGTSRSNGSSRMSQLSPPHHVLFPLANALHRLRVERRSERMAQASC